MAPQPLPFPIISLSIIISLFLLILMLKSLNICINTILEAASSISSFLAHTLTTKSLRDKTFSKLFVFLISHQHS